MAQTKSTETRTLDQSLTRVPEVIVDFVFQDGLFFIAVKNISDRPAYKVSTKFNHKIRGLGGVRELVHLPIFDSISFLAPQKEILVFVDSGEAYFARKEPTNITTKITFYDDVGTEYTTSITHDLEIYRNLPIAGSAKNLAVSDDVTKEGD